MTARQGPTSQRSMIHAQRCMFAPIPGSRRLKVNSNSVFAFYLRYRNYKGVAAGKNSKLLVLFLEKAFVDLQRIVA